MTVDVSTDSRGVTTLALDRPERHNALDAASIGTLRATLDAVRGGTREVGQAAMQSVVISSLLILIANVVIVQLSITLFGDISG